MSEIERMGNVLRAWVGQQWDRIQTLERELALDELNKSVSPGETTPVSAPVQTPSAARDPKAEARMILGVAQDAPFDEVRKAFLKISERSQPGKFVEGTEESRQAEHIQRRVQWAYNILTAETSDTEKRFKSLEIE